MADSRSLTSKADVERHTAAGAERSVGEEPRVDGGDAGQLIDLATDRASIDRELSRLCESETLRALPSGVAEAIRYSILGQGKRLRPILMLAAYRACGGVRDASALAACI